MSVMDGGIMNSQILRSAAGYAPPALLFNSFPSAALVPGQMRMASDLNNAVLISDGTNWSPMNGQAVIANRYNVNITRQSLTEALITAEAFPAGFVRAGSRFRIWVRQKFPGISAAGRVLYVRAGAVGSGLLGNQIGNGNTTQNGADVNGRMCLELTAMGTSGQHVGSSSQNGFGGFATNYVNATAMPTIDFTAPWEIAFSGQSVAETAQTGVTATWAGGVATFTYTNHGYAVGDKIVTSGFTPAGYNGTFIVTGQTANTWTAEIAADPGLFVTGGSTSRISNVTLVDYLIEWLQ